MGRNAQPADPGRICRELGMLMGDIDQAQGQATVNHEVRTQEEPARRPSKKRLVPQEVSTPHEGPRVSSGHELRRLFAPQERERPPATLEEFPRLTRARVHSQEAPNGTQLGADQ
eukprot:9126663-Heterocapsa_arctica.AAC.1